MELIILRFGVLNMKNSDRKVSKKQFLTPDGKVPVHLCLTCKCKMINYLPDMMYCSYCTDKLIRRKWLKSRL